MSAVAVLLAGIAVRLIHIDSGLWLDEIWSMRTSSAAASFEQIIAACRADTHPPFFDLMLHYWLKLFGDSDLSGRLLPFFWGMIGMVLTWFYTLRIFKDRTIAFVSLALLAFNYFHIYYSNEVRFYSFLYVLALMATAHFILFARTSRLRHLIIISITGIIALYTHYFGAFLLVALGVASVILLARKRISRRDFWKFVLSGVVVALAFLPWLRWVPMGETGVNWIAEPAITDFFAYGYNYTGKNPVEFLFLLVGLIGGVYLFRENPVVGTVMYAVVLLGFTLPFALSYLMTPMLHERYTVIYFPGFILLAAWATVKLGAFGWKLRGAGLLVLWISIAVNLAVIHPYFSNGQKEPWKIVAGDLENGPKAPLYTDVKFWMDYYLDRFELEPAREVISFEPAGQFWVLRTPYDAQQWEPTDGFFAEKSIEYSGGYELTLYQEK